MLSNFNDTGGIIMKLNKGLAVMLLLSMCFSVIPTISIKAQASEAGNSEYLIINDQFGDGDACGWTMVNASNAQSSLETVQVSQGNFALKYQREALADGNKEAYNTDHLLRKLNGDTGLTYKSGVNIVIKTRFKVQSNGSGRIFFKTNIDTASQTTVNGGKQTGRSSGWNTLFAVLGNNSGQLHYPTGNEQWGYNVETRAVDSTSYTGLLDGSEWIDACIRIKGTSLEADYEFEADGLSKATGTLKLTQPAVHVNSINDVLKTFSVAYRNNTNTVWIDYFQVYQEGVTVSASGTSVDSVGVKVDITSNSDYLQDISKYFKLYEADGATEVATSSAYYDAKDGKVVIVPAGKLTEGGAYKVIVDKTKLESNLRYTYNGDTVLTVTAPSCSAENLHIEGRIVPNTSLTAKFDIKPVGLTEKGSVYKWYTVDGAGNRTEIAGASGKSFTVTEAYVDSKLTFSVIPKAENAVGDEKTGLETFNTVPALPENAPVIVDGELRYNQDSPMIGYTLRADYDYYDADGDEESGSEIKWYAGSSASATDFAPVGSGLTLEITEAMRGKYIRYTVIPKNNAPYRAEGSLYTSTPIGPCDDIVSASNLLVNGDFETGAVSPWEIYNTWPGVDTPLSIYSEDKYEGNYCLKVATTPINSSGWVQKVDGLKPDTTYIISGMLKATDTASVPYEGYVWNGTADRPYRESEIVDINDNSWTRITHTRINRGTTMSVGFAGYGVVGAGSDGILVDNIYFGKLMIADIKTFDIPDTQVPENGETTIKVSSGEILNQLQTTDGLKAQSVNISVVEGKGIEVKGNYISVTSDAVAGRVRIKVSCEPTLPGVDAFEKYVEFNLLANSNVTPKVSDVKITAAGDVAEGSTLTVTYKFHQVENKADASTYQWVWSDSANGSYSPIAGAVGKAYTVESTYAQKYIKCVVYPKTADGKSGSAVYSNFLVRPIAPTASEVTVTGDWYIDGVVKGNYVYNDDNGDPQGTTTFRWLVSSSKGGPYEPITGAVSDTLTLTSDMKNKYIVFEVSPVSTVAPFDGAKALSAEYIGPVSPYVEDVSISVDGLVYKGNYKYKHSHAIAENGTQYVWTLNGKVVGTEKNYTAKATPTGTLTFTVTPMCAVAPATGDSVSCSISLTSSGGGGGGGGGFSVAPKVENIKTPEITAEASDKKENLETTHSVYKDVSVNEWYYDAVEYVHKNNLMQGTDDGFEPEEKMSRAMLVTVLWRMKNKPDSVNAAEFDDVEEESWYSSAVDWAVSEGIVFGYDEATFGTNDNISREQLVVILYRFAEKYGLDASTSENVDLSSEYDDADLISDYAKEAFKWAVGAGIVNGETKTQLNPSGCATRAQVAAILQRFSEALM